MKGEKSYLFLICCLALALFLSCGKAPEKSPGRGEKPEIEKKTEKVPKTKTVEVAKTVNVPIEFYGAVTDEKGDPVELAEVVADVTVQNQTPPEHAELQEQTAWTDSQGFFSFRDLTGSRLTIRNISRDGYEEFQTTGNPETDYYYSGAGKRLHSPSEDRPVTFVLVKHIEPTYLITMGRTENWEMNVEGMSGARQAEPPEQEGEPTFRFYGRGTVRHDFARKMREEVKAGVTENGPSFTTDMQMTVSSDLGRRGCNITLSSPGEGNGVIVGREYLRRAPEKGYRGKVAFQPTRGRNLYYAYVKSRHPSIYSVVDMRTMVREDNCQLNYTVAVNPYGGTSLEQADGSEEELGKLEEEAVSALNRGELPERPNLVR